MDAQIRSELASVTWDVAMLSNLDRLKGDLVFNGGLHSKLPGRDEGFDRNSERWIRVRLPGIGTRLGHSESCWATYPRWVEWMVNGVFNGEWCRVGIYLMTNDVNGDDNNIPIAAVDTEQMRE